MRAALAASCLAAAVLLTACGSEPGAWPPERGRELIARHGCGSCHVIGGIDRADGDIGPNLTSFKNNAPIAGRLPNKPDAVTRWLLDPQAIKPGTRMPNLGLTPEQARDIVEYLYTQ